MQTSLIRGLLLAAACTPCILAPTAASAQATTGAPEVAAPSVPDGNRDTDDSYAAVWDSLNIYEGEDSQLRLVGRLHLDNYVLRSDAADASDFVVRRARLGAKGRVGKFEAHVETELDLEGGQLYSRLTDAYVAWKFSEAARVTLGKQSVKFTLDGATSSNELITIDRSNVANNFWFPEEYAPGVSLSGKSGKWSYNSGIFSGGSKNREFGKFDAGTFVLASIGRDFGSSLGVSKALVRADFVYNEPDAGSSFTRPFENIGALVFILDSKRWGLSADLVAGDGFLGQSDAVGATATPWFKLTDDLQIVGRYTYLKSEDANGIRLGRYENVVSSGRGDRYEELYGGLNYYIYGHKLKLQTGLTFADLRDSAADGGAFDGWTWTTALRVGW